MFLNRVLPTTRHILSRRALPAKAVEEIVRHRHTRGVPARTPLSLGEQIILGAIIFTSVWFTPYWVLYHIPDYQNEDRNTYTGK